MHTRLLSLSYRAPRCRGPCCPFRPPQILQTMFDGHPSVGMLSTPLLLYHPLELLMGSALAPFLRSRAEARAAGATAQGRQGTSNQ